MSLSSALVYSTRLRVSVCGTGTCKIECLADFLGSLFSPIFAPHKGLQYFQVQLNMRIFLHVSTPTPFNRLFRQPAGRSLLRPRVTFTSSNRMLTVSSIGLAPRLNLRPRLTLIRLALIRKPQSFGEGVSRPLYRYLYLHLLFCFLQHDSSHTFCGWQNAPLPSISKSTASVTCLCPIIIHAELLD